MRRKRCIDVIIPGITAEITVPNAGERVGEKYIHPQNDRVSTKYAFAPTIADRDFLPLFIASCFFLFSSIFLPLFYVLYLFPSITFCFLSILSYHALLTILLPTSSHPSSITYLYPPSLPIFSSTSPPSFNFPSSLFPPPFLPFSYFPSSSPPPLPFRTSHYFSFSCISILWSPSCGLLPFNFSLFADSSIEFLHYPAFPYEFYTTISFDGLSLN